MTADGPITLPFLSWFTVLDVLDETAWHDAAHEAWDIIGAATSPYRFAPGGEPLFLALTFPPAARRIVADIVRALGFSAPSILPGTMLDANIWDGEQWVPVQTRDN